MIFTTLIEPRELHAFMLNQKVSGNRNIIILDCSCSIPDPELGIKLYAKEHIPGAVLVDFDRYVTGKVAQTSADNCFLCVVNFVFINFLLVFKDE